MKQLRLFITLMVFAFAMAISAHAARRIIIVNGHFFNEMPGKLKNSETPAESKFFMLNTPNGARAIGFSSPIELSEDALKYEIPVSEVTEGAELLRRFNEAVKNDKGNSISFGIDSKPLINVGDTFPQFSAVDLNGKTWTNADVEGKLMVLNLWFTGCGPCRSEMPELSSWKDEMPDVMFFSSTYEAPEVARQVLDKGTFNWIPLVSDTQFRNYIGNKGYPLTIIIGKDGKVAAFEYGTSPEQRARLKEKIVSLR